MRPHFILCGLGTVGWRVLEYLRKAGEDVVVINSEPAAIDARLEGVTYVVGDCRQAAILNQARIREARGVIVLTSDDLVNLSTALTARHLHPTLRIVVRMFNQDLITRLGPAAINMHALSTSALSSPLMAMIACAGEALGVFRLPSGASRQIAEFTITEQSAEVGRSLGELARLHPLTVVAHVPRGEKPQFVQDMNPNACLAIGDQLVVCADPATLTTLIARGESESLPERLWGGLTRRLTRVFVRTVAQIDLPVKLCTAIFITVIFVSVIVFKFGMKEDTWIDAFFRTISLMATGADMHGDDVDRGSWQKLYISWLRLIGVALTAAFTAIFTNYLIRANLSSALEVRRIPESGHIIVCGLGNIGFRVVEELRALGELVVAIEQDAGNPFIPSARRLGAAVVLGNAVVPEVLRQAHAESARAVVAATSNELLNLEIALMVREMKPKQRILVRLTDPQLAQTLREAANVRLALSIPELAAPAFVASLYGNEVRSLFQVEGCVLAVYEWNVKRNEPSSLGDLSRRTGFLPIHLADGAGKERSIDLEQPPNVGDRITGIIAVENLQRLFQDEPVQMAGRP